MRKTQGIGRSLYHNKNCAHNFSLYASSAHLYILKPMCRTMYIFRRGEIKSILFYSIQYKCCPPIREETNRELLWTALLQVR
jgi:hypothetical protein